MKKKPAQPVHRSWRSQFLHGLDRAQLVDWLAENSIFTRQAFATDANVPDGHGHGHGFGSRDYYDDEFDFDDYTDDDDDDYTDDDDDYDRSNRFDRFDRVFIGTSFARKRDTVATLDDLAALADTPAGLMALLAGLDLDASRLARTLAWIANASDERRSQLLADATGDDDRSTRAFERLRRSLLCAPTNPDQLAPEVIKLVPLSGVSIRTVSPRSTVDALTRRLRSMGMSEKMPKGRIDLEAKFAAILSDPIEVSRLVGGLSVDGAKLYEFALRHDGWLNAAQLPGGWLPPAIDSQQRYGRSGPTQAIYDLYDSGLIGVDHPQRRIYIWREVIQASMPVTKIAWQHAKPPVAIPMSTRGTGMAGALSLLGRILAAWRIEAPLALNDGGIGVAAIRQLAKQLKAAPGAVGLLVNLAIEMKLLTRHTEGVQGRGRAAREILRWRVSAAGEHWGQMPAADRWPELVHAWLASTRLDDRSALPERVSTGYERQDPYARHVMLRDLETLTTGPAVSGVDAEAFGIWLSWHHPELFATGVKAKVEALRVLGLVPSDGLLTFTSEALRLLRPADAPHDPSPESGDPARVLVQGDNTIVAMPGVGAETQILLDHVGELESSAGARLYRLTEASLRAAMDSGLCAADIESGLREHSSTDLPQSVLYLIHDVERRRGTSVVVSAQTVVVSSDPAVISTAVRVKSAGLRAIGPYTAVSALACDKVRAALAAKDVHVTIEAPPVDQKAEAKRARKRAELEAAEAASKARLEELLRKHLPQKATGKTPLTTSATRAAKATTEPATKYFGRVALTDLAERISG